MLNKYIIGGKTYNEATSTQLLNWKEGHRGSFDHANTYLWRTPKGTYWISGSGNAASRWARSCGQNQWCRGEGARVISEGTARLFVESYGTIEEYGRAFGEPEEG